MKRSSRIFQEFALLCALLTLLTAAMGQSDPVINVGTNVQISSANGRDGIAESMISADPTDPKRLLACAVVTPTNFRGKWYWYNVAYISTDQGLHWKPSVDTRRFPHATDASCAIGPGGVALFFSHVALDRERTKIVGAVFRSMDGGQTWEEPYTIPMLERATVVADSTGGRYRGRFYIAGSANFIGIDGKQASRIELATSEDYGASFTRRFGHAWPEGREFRSVGSGVVTRDGKLLIAIPEVLREPATDPDFIARIGQGMATAEKTGSCRTATYQVSVVASEDGGVSYGPAIKVAADLSPLDRFPSLASDLGSQAFAGNVYIAWTDASGEHPRIKVSRSIDGGRTWSSGFVISDIESENAWQPQLAVNKAGVVLVTWLDRREGVPLTGWQMRARASLDGAQTWLPSVVVSFSAASYDRVTPLGGLRSSTFTDTASSYPELNLFVSADHRQFWDGDYSGIAVDAAGVFHALWRDNRDGLAQLWTAPLTVNGTVTKNGDKELSELQNVSDKISLQIESVTFDPISGVLSVEAKIANSSDMLIKGPLKLRALNLSGGGRSLFSEVQATNSNNGIAGDGAIWDFTAVTGQLKPGDSSDIKKLTFILSKWRGPCDKNRCFPIERVRSDVFYSRMLVFAGQTTKTKP